MNVGPSRVAQLEHCRIYQGCGFNHRSGHITRNNKWNNTLMNLKKNCRVKPNKKKEKIKVAEFVDCITITYGKDQ